LPELADDQRLAGAQRLARHALEGRGILHVLEQQQEDVGLALVQHVIDEIERLEAGFIAGGHHVAEREVLRPAVIEQGKAHAAALRDHRDLAARAAVLRNERRGACFHHRREGRAQGRRRVGEAFRVGAGHRHVVAGGNGADLVLQGEARLIRRLGKARAQDGRRPDAGLAAALELLRHEFRRNDQHRQIGGRRQLVDRAEGLQTLHLGGAATDRIDRPGERMALHDLQDAPAQPAGVGRRTDDGHRARPQQLSDVGHESFSGRDDVLPLERFSSMTGRRTRCRADHQH
jgi:hypothetical protein